MQHLLSPPREASELCAFTAVIRLLERVCRFILFSSSLNQLRAVCSSSVISSSGSSSSSNASSESFDSTMHARLRWDLLSSLLTAFGDYRTHSLASLSASLSSSPALAAAPLVYESHFQSYALLLRLLGDTGDDSAQLNLRALPLAPPDDDHTPVAFLSRLEDAYHTRHFPRFFRLVHQLSASFPSDSGVTSSSDTTIAASVPDSWDSVETQGADDDEKTEPLHVASTLHVAITRVLVQPLTLRFRELAVDVMNKAYMQLPLASVAAWLGFERDSDAQTFLDVLFPRVFPLQPDASIKLSVKPPPSKLSLLSLLLVAVLSWCSFRFSCVCLYRCECRRKEVDAGESSTMSLGPHSLLVTV